MIIKFTGTAKEFKVFLETMKKIGTHRTLKEIKEKNK